VDAGRFLEADDADVTVIGADLAERYDLRVGDTFTMREREFEVIGVLERTLTFPDTIAYVPLRNAQEIYVESVPEAFQERTDELATQIEVFPTDLADADVIAASIEEAVEGVRTVTPEQVADQIGQASIVFNLIIVGASVIAVIVGGLSVINTMVMTVSERVREIGIKKAVGAPTGAILREFVIEATLLGAIGGLIGLSAGALLVVVLNAQTAGSGTTVFLLTPMLLLRSFLFATVLGALAGIYPALRAARLDPVTALRST
jgi:putative ABC transport system permease protein